VSQERPGEVGEDEIKGGIEAGVGRLKNTSRVTP
jgi:hypothetical protein